MVHCALGTASSDPFGDAAAMDQRKLGGDGGQTPGAVVAGLLTGSCHGCHLPIIAEPAPSFQRLFHPALWAHSATP
jgi:hypothetical protein